MIGIIGAMKIEVEAIREAMSDRRIETVSGIELVSGTLYGKKIVVAECGIGKVFAAVCTQIMIMKYHPDIIVNTGVAGTLTHELTIGDIAIASQLVQHDMDTSPIGDPKGLISGINKIYFQSDIEASALIADICRSKGIGFRLGTIASGDQFINDREKKRTIVENFSAVACEMEGAAIAHVAYIGNTRFAVIRAISDDAGGEKHTEYGVFLADAAKKSIFILEEFIKKFEI